LRPTRERAHDTDVLAPETKFARAPDGVHIAYQLLGDIGIVHRAFGRADSVLWLVPPDPPGGVGCRASWRTAWKCGTQ
jgi:hypothetical protein